MADQWVEQLQCMKCGKTGSAELSSGDATFVDHVDMIPSGFKVVPHKNGAFEFYCIECNKPVNP